MLNYHGSGMSVMEMSHRSPVFQEILSEAEADLRTLMHIPDNYKVLFVQGGGTVQFAMVPMNLMKNGVACYVETGAWSKKAIAEAKRYGEVKIVASSADKNFSYHPRLLRSGHSRTTPITSTSAKTRPSTAPPTTRCPTPRARFWWRTSPPCSSPAPATSASTA